MKRHLKFEERPSETGKTIVAIVFSNHDGVALGLIKWHGPWRQYCFFPNKNYETFWSWDCLKEMSDYIQELNLIKKKKNNDEEISLCKNCLSMTKTILKNKLLICGKCKKKK